METMAKTEATHNTTTSANIAKANIEGGRSDLTSDRILSEIGGFGLYQMLIGIASGVAILLSSIDIYTFVFASVIPEHRYK